MVEPSLPARVLSAWERLTHWLGAARFPKGPSETTTTPNYQSMRISTADLAGPVTIDVELGASPQSLDSYITQLDPTVVRTADSYVFRVDADLFARLANPDDADAHTGRTDVLRRVKGLPLRILTYNATRHHLRRITRTGAEAEADETTLLARVRQTDLLRLASDAGDACYYRGDAKHHYVAPSGRHCTSFFRVGDVVRSRESLERLAFWLQPVVARSRGILVDTWSIAAPVLRALQMQNLDIPLDCLSAHPHNDQRSARFILERLAEDLSPGDALTCIVSVTSSGRFTTLVKALASDLRKKPEINSVAIYGLDGAPQGLELLCSLPLNPHNYPADDCPHCNAQSIPIVVHPGLYYLKEYPERDVVLESRYFYEDAQPPLLKAAYDKAGFIARYHNVDGLFAVHRHDRHRRHHAFHLNVGSLLKTDDFLRRLDERLTAIQKPTLIITPADRC